MQVLTHELRRRTKSTFFWSLGIMIFITMSFGKFSTFAQDATASEQIMKAFPATIQAVFGMSGLHLGQLMDYYGIIFLYMAILLAVHAGLAGAGVLSEEEQDKTAEFLYVKPMSRARIVTEKLLAGTVFIATIWIINAVVTWYMLARFAEPKYFSREFWLFMLAFALIQATSFVFGACCAAGSTRPKIPAMVVAGAVMLSYGAFMFEKLSPSMEFFTYISIFSAFDALRILRSGQLHLGAVCVCLASVCVGLILTYHFYKSRDLTV